MEEEGWNEASKQASKQGTRSRVREVKEYKRTNIQQQMYLFLSILHFFKIYTELHIALTSPTEL